MDKLGESARVLQATNKKALGLVWSAEEDQRNGLG